MILLEWLDKHWEALAATFALIVSVIATWITIRLANKSSILSIQQVLFSTSSEKARDCNTLWEDPEPFQELASPYKEKLISELIISIEVIEKSCEIFGKKHRSIKKLKIDYYYLFWKQLRTDLRIWIMKEATKLANIAPDPIYGNQLKTIHQKFQRHFELV